MTELHLKVNGQVQGVGFRYSTWQKARQLGLVGWVRNLPDGSVEILAQGERDDLEMLITWIKTEFSAIEKINENWEETERGFSGFEISY